MRILLDTNIFIPLEDSSILLSDKLTELNRLTTGEHQLLLHPATFQDIERDENLKRKKQSLNRVKKYELLEFPPVLQSELETELFGLSKKSNDKVDNIILYSLYKNCVHWLITEDGGIHKKAKKIGEQDRVLTISRAISILREEIKENTKLFSKIHDVPCYTLDLKDPIFNSLRNGYKNFDDWFNNKCSKTARRAWACIEEKKIEALCIYKREDSPIVNSKNQGLIGNNLKDLHL